MDLDKNKIEAAVQKALEDKGKRKFKQTVEMALNFRGIDFTKPENRVNMEIVLPKGRGKPNNLVIISSDDVVYNLKKKFKEGVLLLTLADAEAMDKKEVKNLAKTSYFFVDPKLIGQVAKIWGRILGPRGRAPRPLIGNPEQAINRAMNTIRLQNRGKYLPTLHTVIGVEDSKVEDLVENAITVIEELSKKIPTGNIKSVYFKLAMGKPAKVER